jgi:hypothetical protein
MPTNPDQLRSNLVKASYKFGSDELQPAKGRTVSGYVVAPYRICLTGRIDENSLVPRSSKAIPAALRLITVFTIGVL